jgi:hypothetical protein
MPRELILVEEEGGELAEPKIRAVELDARPSAWNEQLKLGRPLARSPGQRRPSSSFSRVILKEREAEERPNPFVLREAPGALVPLGDQDLVRVLPEESALARFIQEQAGQQAKQRTERKRAERTGRPFPIGARLRNEPGKAASAAIPDVRLRPSQIASQTAAETLRALGREPVNIKPFSPQLTESQRADLKSLGVGFRRVEMPNLGGLKVNALEGVRIVQGSGGVYDVVAANGVRLASGVFFTQEAVVAQDAGVLPEMAQQVQMPLQTDTRASRGIGIRVGNQFEAVRMGDIDNTNCYEDENLTDCERAQRAFADAGMKVAKVTAVPTLVALTAAAGGPAALAATLATSAPLIAAGAGAAGGGWLLLIAACAACGLCLHPQTLIQGNPQVLPIAKAKKGLKVLGIDGKTYLVKGVTKRQYQGKMINLITSGIGITTLTENHPVLVWDKILGKSWKPANKLSQGDSLFYPKDGAYSLLPLDKIETSYYDGFVYNLAVENSQGFLSTNAILAGRCTGA